MLIEINPESEFAKQLYSSCIKKLESVIKQRSERRKNYLKDNLRSRGQRYGLFWLFKQKENETIEEFKKRKAREDGYWYFPLCLCDDYLTSNLDPYENFIDLFNKGVTFYITEKEYDKIKL